jgi:hypothetical protein
MPRHRKLNTVVQQNADFVEFRASNCEELIKVNKDDWERQVNQYTWCVDANGYPTTNIKQDNGVWLITKLHHMIVGRPAEGRQIDHKNCDKKDARRENLRECLPHQNMANRGLQRNNRTNYKGVKPNGRGFAAIVGGRYIGTYPTATAAAHAYNAKVVEVYGEFARLNEV